MYEKLHEPLSTFSKFLRRLFKNLFFVFVLISIALFIGMSGYHFSEKMPWIDAFINASMILSGMGPVSTLQTAAGKLFAGFYALFSGLFFIFIMGLILAPIAHRFFHQMHLATKTPERVKHKK